MARTAIGTARNTATRNPVSVVSTSTTPVCAVLDDFNRANASTLGSNWSVVLSAGPNSGNQSIVSNTMYQEYTGFTNYSIMYWNPTSFNADQEVYMTMTTKSSSSSNDCMELFVRLNNLGANYNGYGLQYTDSGFVKIQKITNGSGSDLATAAATITDGTIFRLEAIGSTLRAYVCNSGVWSLVVSTTDTTYASGGYIGHYLPGNTQDGRFDNFGGGNLVGSATRPRTLLLQSPTYIALGDSLTSGYGASGSAQMYVNIIQAAFAWPSVTNVGVSGDMVADWQVKAFARTINQKDQITTMITYNDALQKGEDATWLNYMSEGLLAGLAWLGLPQGNKTKGQDAGPNYTGTWTNTSNYGGTLGKESSTLTDSVSFTVTGTTIYIASLKCKTGGGGFSLVVDGGTPVSYTCSGSATTSNGIDDHAFIVRLSGLTNTAHTITMTVNVAGRTPLLWYATTNGTNVLRNPDVYVGNCLRMLDWTGASGGGSDATSQLYNASYIQPHITTLTGDGLNLTYVDAYTALPKSAGYYYDAIHPNDAGYALIAAAFTSAINPNYARVTV